MKKIRILLTAGMALLASLSLHAQEYAVDMSSGKLILSEVNRVEIEGTTGSQILFATESRNEEHHKRADGLREISAMGLTDNTGIGLSVEKSGAELTVKEVSRNSDTRYVVKVPKGVAVYYEHSSWEGKTLRIRDLESEIEVSANYNSIELDNVTGPMAINTVYGHIDATFSKVKQESPILLHSVYDHVDVSVPAGTKANFKLSTSYGKIYTDLDLEMDQGEGGLRPISSNKIEGTLNGGGVDFSIKATYSEIYLRKK